MIIQSLKAVRLSSEFSDDIKIGTGRIFVKDHVAIKILGAYIFLRDNKIGRVYFPPYNANVSLLLTLRSILRIMITKVNLVVYLSSEFEFSIFTYASRPGGFLATRDRSEHY